MIIKSSWVCNDNSFFIITQVTFEDLASEQQVLQKILDVITKHLRSTTIQEFKIKWMDKSTKL